MFKQFLCIGFLLALPVPICAQSNYAVVRGAVYDPQHHAVPGATIQLTATATGAKREVISNESGLLQATHTGFAVSDQRVPLHPPSQYIQQWSASIEKALGKETTLEIGYLGSGGWHLQRAHLINNAQPGPGLIQPRRPHPKISFVPNTVFPSNVTVASTTFPISTINYLENSAQSWYDAGYVNVRRRYANGLSLLANYTYAKSLTNAPDFRSPMFEAAIPQNNYDLSDKRGLERGGLLPLAVLRWTVNFRIAVAFSQASSSNA